MEGGAVRDSLFGPLVLSTNLILFFGGEVVLDVERLADLLRGLPFDHVCDGLAADIKEGLDVEIVGSLVSLGQFRFMVVWGRESKRGSLQG